MKHAICLIIIILCGCTSFDPEARIAHKISKEVQKEWSKKKGVNCQDYTDEILRRCEEKGITVKSASFSKGLHNALIWYKDGKITNESVVIDSTGAMIFCPVKLADVEWVTGYRLYKLALDEGELFNADLSK